MSFACLKCRKSFKKAFQCAAKRLPGRVTMPWRCNSFAYNPDRNFKSPKKTGIKQCEKVKLLIERGFFFQKIWPESNTNISIPYPDNLEEEAKNLVIKYIK